MIKVGNSSTVWVIITGFFKEGSQRFWNLTDRYTKHETTNKKCINMSWFHYIQVLVYRITACSPTSMCNNSNGFILKRSESLETCFVSRTPYMITISEIGIDERIVKWYQSLFVQILACLYNHTNSTGDFARYISNMLFPRQFIIN